MPPTTPLVIPEPGRPHPLPDYGVPETGEGLLSWDFVVARMTAARNYWIATILPNGLPHAVPIWGVWLEDRLHFGGGPQTRWSRNLARNPNLVAHSESGAEVVIIEGMAIGNTDAQSAMMKRLDDAYEAKYNLRHGPPIWTLHPEKVLAWKEYPTSVTRWVFPKTSRL